MALEGSFQFKCSEERDEHKIVPISLFSQLISPVSSHFTFYGSGKFLLTTSFHVSQRINATMAYWYCHEYGTYLPGLLFG